MRQQRGAAISKGASPSIINGYNAFNAEVWVEKMLQISFKQSKALFAMFNVYKGSQTRLDICKTLIKLIYALLNVSHSIIFFLGILLSEFSMR